MTDENVAFVVLSSCVGVLFRAVQYNIIDKDCDIVQLIVHVMNTIMYNVNVNLCGLGMCNSTKTCDAGK